MIASLGHQKTKIQYENQKLKSVENQSPSTPQKASQEQALREAATKFEEFFVNEMFKEMRNEVNPSKLLPKSQGEKIFRGMLDEQYAKSIADSNRFGLGQLIYEQSKKYL